MSRSSALLLRAFAVWTVYVWVTRIWNILGDDTTSVGFKVVHSVLAVISVAFAVAAWFVVRKERRSATARAGEPVGTVAP
jgi:hypothetical protein